MAGLFLGIDIGTGGVRAGAIRAHGNAQGFASAALPTSRQRRRLSAQRSSSSCSRSSRSSRRIKASTQIGLGELASGPSDTGAAALLQQLTAEQMEGLTAQLKPEQPAGLDYDPLFKQGERFPIPIASVETVPYRRLALLGAPPLRRVIAIDGCGNNSARVAIWRRIVGVPITNAEQTEASYDAALLALHGGPPP